MKKNRIVPWQLEYDCLKIFRIMKISLLMFILCGLSVSAASYSQEKQVTISVKDATLLDIFDKIEKTTDFGFLINDDQIDLSKKYSLNVKDGNITELLNQLLDKKEYKYSIIENNVVITKLSARTAGKDNRMVQQQLVIKGLVTDKTGEPLPGVNVYEKSKPQNGVITGINGTYTINVDSPDDVLMFSYIGFETQSINVAGRSSINITLVEEATGLDEVVVVGYGTQKKVNLTGSVAQVNSEVLENRPVKDVGAALKGVMPGLNIETNSGAPDATASFNIRGFTGLNKKASPLILVDGVEQDINQINPEDVASVSILKDAAASAIYGSRAPYGVILITTKKGKEGKMQINVSSNVSFSDIVGIPESLNSLDFANSFNEAYRNGRNPNRFDDETIQRIKDYQAGKITTTNVILDPSNPNSQWGVWWMANANVDWMKESFKTAVNQKHTVSFSGGLEGGKLNYYASMGYSGNNGQLAQGTVDKYARYNTVLKLDSKVNDWLGLSLNTRYSRREADRPNSAHGESWQFDRVLRMWPSLPLKNPDGNIPFMSPFLDMLGQGNYIQKSDDIWVTGGIELTPLKGLTIKGNYSWNTHARDRFNPLYTVIQLTDWTDPETNQSYYHERVQRNGTNSISKIFNHDSYHQAEMYANYEYTLANHNFGITGGYQQELKNYSSISGSKTNLITEDIPSFSTAIGENPSLGDALSHWSTRGYFARITYNYNGIYLVEFNGRYDGSSRFPEATRDEFFPSVSVGYNIAKENFWNIDQINLFKLRGSYGELGDQNVSNYLYLPSMDFVTKTGNVLGGSRVNEIRMPGLVSPNITWEKPRVIDLGFDIAALDNRLSITYDWYQRTTYDQLGPAETLPETLGASVPRTNNAVTETRGWDMSVTWRNQFQVAGKPFSYDATVTVSDYIGYVVDYDNETGAYSGNWTPGEVFGDIYGYKVDKVAQSSGDYTNGPSHHRINSNHWYPGDLVYQDLDGDGKIDGGATGHNWYSKGDLTVIGNSSPRYIYGIMLGADWNGFDIRMNFEGVGKRDVMRTGALFQGMQNGSIWNSTLHKHSSDYWTPDNRDAFYTRPYIYGPGSEKNYINNDRFLSNGAYLRFSTLSLGYTFSNRVTELLSMQKLKLYATVENVGLLINKSHTKLDPIFLNNSYTYPPQRTISLGANITF